MGFLIKLAFLKLGRNNYLLLKRPWLVIFTSLRLRIQSCLFWHLIVKEQLPDSFILFTDLLSQLLILKWSCVRSRHLSWYWVHLELMVLRELEILRRIVKFTVTKIRLLFLESRPRKHSLLCFIVLKLFKLIISWLSKSLP